MISNVAVLEFKTNDPDSNFTFKVSDVKDTVTELELEALMDYVIANDVLRSPSHGQLTGKVSATIQTTETTEMQW